MKKSLHDGEIVPWWEEEKMDIKTKMILFVASIKTRMLALFADRNEPAAESDPLAEYFMLDALNA